MVDVATDCHLERACQGLEDTFYLVVFVLPLRLDVQVHLGSIAQTLEEVEEHFRRHLANALTEERGIPYKPGTATEVESYRAEAVVHRQAIAVTFYATLVAQCLQ